jgi:hypothetical protein
MTWRKNRRLAGGGLNDLEYVPTDRHGWDCTLAALAYGARREIERRPPDLNAWAARHGAPASARYEAIGPDAWVLWHGTTRPRAERIVEHGLFHFKGLWTTFRPRIAHGFCRGRSDRFGPPGAMVCLVLDRAELTEGHDYDIEGAGAVVRFHGRLGPEVVEYVLFSDEVRFTGEERAAAPQPWRTGRFKRQGRGWVPVQRSPVRYSETEAYSTVEEFAQLTALRLFADLGAVAAIELFSTLYALMRPWDVLAHEDVKAILEEQCESRRRPHLVFRHARADGAGVSGHPGEAALGQ